MAQGPGIVQEPGSGRGQLDRDQRGFQEPGRVPRQGHVMGQDPGM